MENGKRERQSAKRKAQNGKVSTNTWKMFRFLEENNLQIKMEREAMTSCFFVVFVFVRLVCIYQHIASSNGYWFEAVHSAFLQMKSAA